MVALVKAMQSGRVKADPVLVFSNRPDAGGLAKAQALGVATASVDHKLFSSREAFEAEMAKVLADYAPDILCFAGFLRILTPSFVSAWEGRAINVHPSILPLFPGLNTHQRALDAGMAVHGVTVHRVIPELDAGAILGQALVPIEDGDTAESLAARVLKVEHELYPQALARFVEGKTTPFALFRE